MIYTVKHRAFNGEHWVVEIKAQNKPSAIEQVRWWYDVGRYLPEVSHKMTNYGFRRYKLAKYDTWVYA